jgi:glycosyltransferase involved in cell wall biosynthesis
VIFVDDGSRDQTLSRVRAIAEQRPESVSVVALAHNQGKAEAVRQGLLHALSGNAGGNAAIVGYVDADLATPPSELRRLTDLARNNDYDILMAARVQLLGRHIERKSARHYLGRVFATCASFALGLPVYDTQCGAKLFRRGPALAAALEEPFLSRWAFDVELLARLVRPRPGIAAIPQARIREEPLLAWTDVPGSKLFPSAALRSGIELLRIGWKLRRR